MSMAKMFKEQREWLNKATKNIDTQKMSEKVLDFPETMKVKRQEAIQTKISTLKKQKEEVVRRYDQAIEEQERELVDLEKTIDVKKLKDMVEGKTGQGPSKKARAKSDVKKGKVKRDMSGTKKLKRGTKNLRSSSNKKKK